MTDRNAVSWGPALSESGRRRDELIVVTWVLLAGFVILITVLGAAFGRSAAVQSPAVAAAPAPVPVPPSNEQLFRDFQAYRQMAGRRQ